MLSDRVGATFWQQSFHLQVSRLMLTLLLYAEVLSCTSEETSSSEQQSERESNTNPLDNEPRGGRRWALSEKGALLLLERPKRAINPQIQRRTEALSSLRKAWDVSAVRTNHTASPAEVASSVKLFCSSGYYAQILSICCPCGCRQGISLIPPLASRGISPCTMQNHLSLSLKRGAPLASSFSENAKECLIPKSPLQNCSQNIA